MAEILNIKKLLTLDRTVVLQMLQDVESKKVTPEQALEQVKPNKWLNLYETRFKVREKESSWIFASRKLPKRRVLGEHVLCQPNAVVIVPVLVEPNGNRKLVVVKEFRVPIQDYEYHFPAGLWEKGEPYRYCARRELREETGLELTRVLKVSSTLTSSAGLTDETSIMVYVECERMGDQQLEPTEEIEVLLLDIQGVRDLMNDSDKLIGAKTWTVLLMYDQLAVAGREPFVIKTES